MSMQSVVLLPVCVAVLCAVDGFPQSTELARPHATGFPVRRLPDTGQTVDYTVTIGEDSDYGFNTPAFTINGDGTVTDNITGLMWQQSDGGEKTFESAILYCDSLTLPRTLRDQQL
jgi:hypothetical protein